MYVCVACMHIYMWGFFKVRYKMVEIKTYDALRSGDSIKSTQILMVKEKGIVSFSSCAIYCI